MNYENIFTETENGINIDANNIEINCITSKQNKFNLDSEGNLSVNSITTCEGNPSEIDYEELFDLIYPIGSIYLTVNNVNPSVLFGGTWEEWGKGKVPVGVDTSQTEFDIVEKTGGSKLLQSHNHTGTTSVNGSHQHATNNSANIWNGSRGTLESWGDGNGERYILTHAAGEHSHTFTTNNSGSGNSQNLQPYITCYMWKRII